MFALLSMEFFQSRKIRSEQYRPEAHKKKCMLQVNILAADLFTLAIRLQVTILGLMQNPLSVCQHKTFEKQLLPMLTANSSYLLFAFSMQLVKAVQQTQTTEDDALASTLSKQGCSNVQMEPALPITHGKQESSGYYVF